jgi:hypothetical protein
LTALAGNGVGVQGDPRLSGCEGIDFGVRIPKCGWEQRATNQGLASPLSGIFNPILSQTLSEDNPDLLERAEMA